MTHSHNSDPITKFIDIFELMDCLRVSRTTIKRWNSNGAMPEGIRIGPRLVRWERTQIEKWIEAGCPKLSQEGEREKVPV